MKIKFSFSVICYLIIMLVRCDDQLDSWVTESETIPPPTEETIAFMALDGTLCISNSDYSKYFRLTFQPSNEQDWSPDKQWLCFMHDFKIWKMKYDGSSKIQLAPSSMTCEFPKFSPNGSKILFVANRNRPDEFITDIYIMKSDGSKIEKITESELLSKERVYYFSWPDWLNNGKKIIFEYAEVSLDPTKVQSHLGILDLDTYNLTTLSSLGDLQPFNPRPSPTRDEFVFVSLLSRIHGGADIFRANIDGTDVVRLTQSGKSWLPDWSRDGEKIIYSELGENSVYTMRIMNRDGTNNHQLKIADQEFALGPTW